ncbi:hypothetical protein ANSO36C_62450 [Nostoc cf. commune SO-36]|uniref:histidine kinase n=1 Tax=Nostoc cf. commune SO-36 TaxID=449208 RepID=A0ABM7ZAZ4_NOSCO|nr:hypothetical protein ANSO36C_62450 [Nostoc cf. commune SO-36]
MVVDDDPQIQALLQTLLHPWGLKAIALEDPRQFWETLEAFAPDMLILDVELPYTRGIELCKLVRNDPHWSELPILFLTVHSDAEMVNQVFSVGADDFVSKPIVGPELVTRIVNRLERVKLRQRVAQGGKAVGEDEAGGVSFSSSYNFRAINELELRVAERTAELIRVNEQLQSQLDERQRTPLTSIYGSLGMLASGLLPTDSEQAKRLLQIATDSSERLGSSRKIKYHLNRDDSNIPFG